MKNFPYILIFLLFLAGTAHAQFEDDGAEEKDAIYGTGNTKVYKWTDDKGNVHYTQYKPANFKAVEVEPPPPPPLNSPDLNKPYANQINDNSKKSGTKSGKNSRPDLSQSEIELRKKNCETAKQNLKTLQENRIVSYSDDSGVQARLSEEQKQASIEDSKKQIEYFCN